MKLKAATQDLIFKQKTKIAIFFCISIPLFVFEEKIRSFCLATAENVSAWIVGELVISRYVMIVGGSLVLLSTGFGIYMLVHALARNKANSKSKKPTLSLTSQDLSDDEVLLLAVLEEGDGDTVDIDEIAEHLGVKRLRFRQAGERLKQRGAVWSVPAMVIIHGQADGDKYGLTERGTQFLLAGGIVERLERISPSAYPNMR